MTTQDAQAEVLALLGDPATHGGSAVERDRHPCGGRVSGGDAGLQGQARGAIPVSRLFDAREAQGRLRGRACGQPPFAPADLSRRRADHPRRRAASSRSMARATPVEWAVEMVRFDENRDARSGWPTRDADRRRARRRARPRRGRAPTPRRRSPMPSPGSARLAAYIEQNRRRAREHPRAVRAGTGRSSVARQPSRPCGASRGCCASAAGVGLVRRGHGDLHLGNIVLIDGKPVLFDAIEFDPLIATGDVLYDLAFLLMDLVERGLDAAANVVLNRYLAETRRHRRSRRAGGAAALSVGARRDPRQGDGGEAAIRREARRMARSRRGAKLFRPGAAPDRAARAAFWSRSAGCPAPASRRSRVRSRPRCRRRPAPSCCAPTSSARRMFGEAETERLPADRLYARGHAPGLCDARRQGAPRDRAPAIRRSSMRCSRSADERAQIAAAAHAEQRAVPRPVSHRRSRHPRRARDGARARCLRCRCGRRAPAGELRRSAHRVDRGRRLRRPRAHIDGGAGRDRQPCARLGRPAMKRVMLWLEPSRIMRAAHPERAPIQLKRNALQLRFLVAFSTANLGPSGSSPGQALAGRCFNAITG